MNHHDRPDSDDTDDNIDIELDWSELRSIAPEASDGADEIEERDTLPPPVPTDQYAAEIMATAEGSWADLPPPAPFPPLPTSHVDEPIDPAPKSGLRRSSTPPNIARAGNDPMHEIRGRFILGDFSGALVMAEAVLAADPSNAEAKDYALRCRNSLAELYISRLGGMSGVPELSISFNDLRHLSLDHRAGFLLSLVDGMSSIEDILDLCGMSNLEALRTIFELMQQDVIRVA